jgi:DNA invertase Pin-like site-specific DNA recombinase
MAAPALATRKLRAVNFERVSTDRQETERQRYDLEDNCEQYNLEVVDTVRMKISGPKVNTQEAWLQMLEGMKMPERDAMNLSALDRLFRPEDFAIIGQALQVFKDYKKVIVSTKEGLIEPWTPRGWQTCMEAVLQAGKELAELKRRTKGGRRKAHAENKPMNVAAPYGILYRDKYSRDAEGKAQYFYEDPAPASNGQTRREVVAMVFHWRADLRWRIGNIRAELNRLGILSAGYKGKGGKLVPPGAWGRSTVQQLLKNRHYIGEHWEGGKQVDVACPVFVDRATFDRAQEVTKDEKRRSNGRPARKNLLSTFLRCKYCGRRFRTTTGSNREQTYICGNVSRERKQLCKANTQVICSALDNLIFDLVWKHATDPDLLLANGQAYYDSLPKPTGLAQLQKEAEQLQAKMKRIQKMVKEGGLDYDEGMADIFAVKARIAEIEAQARAAGRILEPLPSIDVVRTTCKRIAAAGGKLKTFAERRPILDGLMEFTITWDRGIALIEGKVPVAAAASKCARGEHAPCTSVQCIPFQLKAEYKPDRNRWKNRAA